MTGGRRKGDEPAALYDALRRIGTELGLPDPDALAAVTERWDEVVGPSLALHARPGMLRDGVLTIEVDGPGWATQLRYLEADVLRRLAEVAGPEAARRLRVRLVP